LAIVTWTRTHSFARKNPPGGILTFLTEVSPPLAVHFPATMLILLVLTVLAIASFDSFPAKISDASSLLSKPHKEAAGATKMTKHMTFDVDRSPTIISALIHGGAVSGLDVTWLRREVFADGLVSREQANELFAVACSRTAKSAEWTPFFVEMITDHLLWQSRPTGIVGGDDAEWLVGKVDEAGSLEALAALVNVLAEAHRAPKWLIAAARERAARWPGVKEAVSRAKAG
jgi:hypothetical protein